MKRIVAALIAAVSLSACGPNADKPLNYIVAPTESDSLTYYYGLLEGAAYWREARTDTLMAGKDQRKHYLKGLRDGLDAVTELNDPYHRGLEQGLELATELFELHNKYGVKVDTELLYLSVEYALKNDSVADTSEARSEYARLLKKVMKQWTDKKKEDIRLSLAQEAAKLKMRRISDNLYMSVTTPGKGPVAKSGDIVFINADYRLPGGRDLGFPSSETLRVGSVTMPGVITEALSGMSCGETAVIATTAMSLFGERADAISLKPEDVVLVTLSIQNIENPDTLPGASNISL